MPKKDIQVLKGFRDYLPQDQIARNKIISKIQSVFERFGFEPMDTPALESYELLGGKYGEEGEQLMYKFEDQGGRKVALRYDLTVPLSRFIANNQGLVMPFKRYQIGSVWRAEKPQKGRFREFMQCDADIVGSSSELADAEIIAIFNEAFKALEVGEVEVKINNRKYINLSLEALQVSEKKCPEFMRIMDKVDKVGREKTQGMLKEAGFAKTILSDYEAEMQKQIFSYQEEFQNLLGSFEVSNVKFNPFLMRGMDYYTGIIFEFVLKEKPEFGSIAGGGRYDNLIGKLAEKDLPAVGCSIGMDRLFAALQDAGKIAPQTAAEVIIFNLDKKLTAEYLNMATNLRNAGVDCEIFYETAKLDKQFKYAQSKNIQVAVIFGQEEAQNKKVNIKNLMEKRQETVGLEDLITEVKSMLW
jgi:histidyl-tRNA synthetase